MRGPGADCLRDRLHGNRHRAPAARVKPNARSASRNFAVVEVNGAIAKNLICFVTFALEEDHVPRMRLFNCFADSRRAIGSIIVFRIRAAQTYQNIVHDLQRLFQYQLSLVRIATSLNSPATCPINGRFMRSRSPPQPNRVITRFASSDLAAAMAFFAVRRPCASSRRRRRKADLRRRARTGQAPRTFFDPARYYVRWDLIAHPGAPGRQDIVNVNLTEHRRADLEPHFVECDLEPEPLQVGLDIAYAYVGIAAEAVPQHFRSVF